MTIACLLLDAGRFGNFDREAGPSILHRHGQWRKSTVSAERMLVNVPVRTPSGSKVVNFQRIEIKRRNAHGVGTAETYRTVAIPLDRLRFNPAGREVLTNMSWLEANTAVPSVRRAKGSRWYPYGRPVG
jgi:hypothetical protein